MLLVSFLRAIKTLLSWTLVIEGDLAVGGGVAMDGGMAFEAGVGKVELRVPAVSCVAFSSASLSLMAY